ncbi:TetR family transcriptional regulator [Arthrobacter sp. NPDC058097]|uniref:TetR family transcriptional regulator n=1 Tax=Arthrobacter sp. NPDC058097 TaxID=3346340 RepID=UPI0036D8B9BA
MNDRSLQRMSPARESLFEAAIGSFAEFGFGGASMRTIAQRAGMALSNLYNYAPSKQDLLVQILKTANYNHLAHTEWAISGAGNHPADQLRAGVRAYVEYVVAHPAEALVAQTELRYLDAEHRRRLVVARDRIDEMLQGIITTGTASGTFITPFPREATRAILTMCGGVAQWYRPDGSLTGDEVANRYAQLALAMVQDAASLPTLETAASSPRRPGTTANKS